VRAILTERIFRKMKKIIATIVCLVMSLQMMTGVFAKEYPQRFYDVPKDHWAFEYIAELVDRGVIAGYEDGSFKPNKTVSRAEFAKIMVGAAGIVTADNSLYFTDMQGHWAIPYVNAAREYLTAYADNTYRPNQAAVREDVTMAMVKLKGYDISDVDFSYLSGFTDTDSISNNVKTYVAVAVEKGLISGFEDNTFRGQGTLTRAEAATLLWKAFQYGNDNKVSSASANQEVIQETPIAETSKINENESETKSNIDTTEKEETPAQPKSDNYTHKITTIINCDINGDAYYYETDGKNLYYADNAGAIKKYDFDEQKSTTILELKELDIDTEDEAFADFEVYSLAYDADANKIYVQGRYNEVNSPNYDGALWIYLIDLDGTYELTTDYWIGTYDDQSGIGSKVVFSRIISAYSDYFVEEHALLTKDFDYIGTICDSVGDYTYGYILDSKMNGDTLNFTAFTKGWYNTKRLFEYKQGKVSTLQEFSSGATAIGLNSKNVIVAENNTLTSYNYKGKKNYVIDNTNLDGAGLTGLDTSVFASKIIVLDNNNIVVYDTRDKAFKYIEEL
jgi:hypothetical protein